jgi:CHAD domain-containing protein
VVALHDLRIACKNLRYASELLRSSLPPERAHSEKPAARFQKHLGEVHDLDVAADIVRRARSLTRRDIDKLLGWLGEKRAKRIATFIDDRDKLALIATITAPSPASADPTHSVPSSPKDEPSPSSLVSPKE